MIDLEAAAGILREIGRHHTALGRLYDACADIITREAPTLPSFGSAAHVDTREPSNVRHLIPYHDSSEAACGTKSVDGGWSTMPNFDGHPDRCPKCCEVAEVDPPAPSALPVAEMATHAPVDDDTEPPDSHPFAAPIPPAPPAVDVPVLARVPGAPGSSCQAGEHTPDSVRSVCTGCGDPLPPPPPEQTTLADAVRERTGCVACADIATTGRTGQAHTCEPIPFGDDAAPPLPVDDTVAGRVSARIAAGTTGRSRKPAKDWEPSDTSWARTASIPLRVTCAEAVAAYIASCGPRHVKPGDRDFVRWVRAQDAAKQTDGLS